MINISEIVADWPKDKSGLSISPGVAWCEKGTRIIVKGDRASIGEWTRIGDGASIGEWTRIGDGASIGEWARIGDRARIGEWARIGDGASIGEWVHIGDRACIGDGASGAIDIGFADGYRKCIAEVDGVAYIGAGCRWFTLDAAIAHWSNKPDRVLTMCLMESAKAIAKVKGWKQS